MSKSDEESEAGCIMLMDDVDTVRRKFKRAVTDSGTEIQFDPSRPAITNLLTIFQLLGVEATTAIGDVTPNASVSLSGDEATTAVGDVTPNTSVSLSGNEATTAIGDVTPNTSVSLSRNLSSEQKRIEDHFAGKGYAQLKEDLADATIEFLKPFQERVRGIDDGKLDQILERGAARAEEIAKATLAKAKVNMGLVGARK
jgi:tryptophanyl-tRNA synthetase